MSTKAHKDSQGHELSDTCIKAAVSMLVNIVETACEHESDLELMRMVNFIDLYRTYLSCMVVPSKGDSNSTVLNTDSSVLESKLGTTTAVSFERFISDSRLLDLAAAAASREYGVFVAMPPPLKISANGSQA